MKVNNESFSNTRFLMKPGLHLAGGDLKRKGKFILCAKNKLRHEFQNLLNKNVKANDSCHLEDINGSSSFLSSKASMQVMESDYNAIDRLGKEHVQWSASKRIKHPRVLLPEKNK